jgi:hypothetical protein
MYPLAAMLITKSRPPGGHFRKQSSCVDQVARRGHIDDLILVNIELKYKKILEFFISFTVYYFKPVKIYLWIF